MMSFGFGFYRCYLVHFAILVIGSPFTNLFAVFEIARPQPCPIFPEKLPITDRDPIGCLSFRPDAPILMVFDVFLRWHTDPSL